jgi:hypothetical protein
LKSKRSIDEIQPPKIYKGYAKFLENELENNTSFLNLESIA